jgi:hypothetical protein
MMNDDETNESIDAEQQATVDPTVAGLSLGLPFWI